MERAVRPSPSAKPGGPYVPLTADNVANRSYPLTRDAYTRVKAVTRLAAGSGYDYYNASWGVLSLLLMTGNLVDFSAGP